MKIYIASKTKYADRWLRLRARGWPITCSWLTRFRDYDYNHLPDVAEQCIREASECDTLIVYAAFGDELRGAFMEAGAALACGKPIYLVNNKRWAGSSLPDLLTHPQIIQALLRGTCFNLCASCLSTEQKNHHSPPLDSRRLLIWCRENFLRGDPFTSAATNLPILRDTANTMFILVREEVAGALFLKRLQRSRLVLPS